MGEPLTPPPVPRDSRADRRFIVILGVVGVAISLLSVELALKVLIPLLPSNWYHPPASVNVGYVSDWKGTVFRVRGAGRLRIDDIATDHRLELEDLDKLETTKASEVTITLPSQDQILVPEYSIVSLEAWNSDDPHSPIYIKVLMGDVVSKRQGVRGGAYVIREGRLFYPAQRPGHKASPLVVTHGTINDIGLREAALQTDVGEALPTASPRKDDLDGAIVPQVTDAHTLSNEYVQDMINSRQVQFQKCWLSRLKDRPALKGKLTLQFEITRRGRVRDLKIADSDLDDEPLHQCVMTVVERLPFRTFMGPEIAIAYPIRFE